MTTEEAIAGLNKWLTSDCNLTLGELWKAIEKGVDALSEKLAREKGEE